MSEINKAMVSRIYEAIWNRRNLADVAEHFANDFLGHSITEIQGLEGMTEWVDTLFHAFPSSLFTIQDQVAEGDKVVTRWIACGTSTGEFEGLPPTGKMFTIEGIDIFRIANSKIIEGWMVADIRSDNHEEIEF